MRYFMRSGRRARSRNLSRFALSQKTNDFLVFCFLRFSDVSRGSRMEALQGRVNKLCTQLSFLLAKMRWQSLGMNE